MPITDRLLDRCHAEMVLEPSRKVAADVRVTPRPGPRTGTDAAYRHHRQQFRHLRRAARRSASGRRILPIAAIVVGLVATAGWTAFLGYQLFQVIELMF